MHSRIKCTPIALHMGCIILYRRVTSPLHVDSSIVSTVHVRRVGARQSRHEPEVTPSSDPAPRAPPGVVKTKIETLITGQIYHRKYRERVCVRAREHVRGAKRDEEVTLSDDCPVAGNNYLSYVPESSVMTRIGKNGDYASQSD